MSQDQDGPFVGDLDPTVDLDVGVAHPVPSPAGESEPASDTLSPPAPAAARTTELAPAGGRWADRIAALDELHGRPLAEHADAYDALHVDLKRRLGEVDGH